MKNAATVSSANQRTLGGKIKKNSKNGCAQVMIRMHAPGQNADPSSIQIQYTKQAIQDQWLNIFTDN